MIKSGKRMEKYLVVIKWFQLLYIQLLSAAIVESIKSNEVVTQLGNERLDRSHLINAISMNITTTGKSLSKMTDCSLLSNCLRCNVNGCIKCTNFLMKDSRQCLEKCPNNYINQWSTSSELMGQICVQSTVYNSIQTVLVGIICGAFLCVLVVFISAIILKKRQQKLHKKLIKDQLINDEFDQLEFIRQLDDLRPYSEYFLFMLNDTRKQIRKSYLSGDTTAAAKFYPIIRDLAKILILLNRQIEVIDGPPHDWNRLLQWADRILAQYKSQLQTKEFIEFLQSSSSHSSSRIFNNEDTRLVSDHTTFKSLFYSTPVVHNRKKIILPSIESDLTKNTNINQKLAKDVSYKSTQINFDISPRKYIHTENKQELSQSDHVHNDKNKSGSLISLQDFVNESHLKIVDKKHYPSNFESDLEHINSYQSKGSLQVVDDDLIEFKLGLRPQDEIITEL
ncbi:unnamed protein product [Chironomus riparius]|uniref:T48 n=1 Tax=Chironomus riparius TaxID=315576 RepID=A0A1Z1LVV6_9DIPT|nr:t48 [Chironomus riparius]CAG9807921.1 unnamed protein product [Chironomus riparius]